MRNLICMGALACTFLIYAAFGLTDVASVLILALIVVTAVTLPGWVDRFLTLRGLFYALVAFVLFLALTSSGLFTTGYDNARRAHNWHWIMTGEGTYRR